MKQLIIAFCVFLVVSIASDTGFGEIHLSSDIAWQVGVGTWPASLGWGDFDDNGWIDIVTGVGIDVEDAPDVIYFNDETGLSITPGWQSVYEGGSCLLYVGDLDNDGDLDLVVPSDGRLGSNFPQEQVIYYNNDGFPASPGWVSEPLAAWSCVAGDADGDGDLDLVFPDHANNGPNRIKMFINDGGVFSTAPSWLSDAAYAALDAAFCDFDLDGDLDLAVTGIGEGVLLFINHDGVIETTPSWTSSAVDGGPQLAVGDVNNDGYPDLAVAGGFSEEIPIFMNIGGTLETTPSWLCTEYPSSDVSFGDADADGDLDLAMSVWQGPAGVFENVDGTLSSLCVWLKSVGGSPQRVVWADYDQDGLVDTVAEFTADGARKLFVLKQKPIHKLTSVAIDDVPLDYSQFCYDPAEGYVSLAVAPPEGSTVSVSYTYSLDLDLSIGSTSACIIENNIDLYMQPYYVIDSVKFIDDNGDGFHDPGETTRFYFYMQNVGTSDTNVTMTMTSSDPEVVFTTPSVFFGTIEGDRATVDNQGSPIEYIVPDVSTPRFDSFFVTIESNNGIYREVFGLEQAVGHALILLVDDDRGGSYEATYESDLRDLQTPVKIWNKQAGGSPTCEEMLKCHLVCWFTGDSADEYLSPDDIIAIKEYLDSGGNLFLTGQGLAEELHAEDSAFLEDYLHARFAGKHYYYKQRGVFGSPIGDALTVRFDNGSSQSDNETDLIIPVNGAEEAFYYTNATGSYNSLSYAGDYKLVFLAWGYEALSYDLPGYSMRDTVMARVLSFFPQYVCGDANNDEAINLVDVTFTVNYLYKEGPEPASEWAADPNGDGTISILDVTYLINFLYKEGPEPLCE